MKSKRSGLIPALRPLLLALAAAAAVLALCTAVSNVETGGSAEGARQLEDSIRRATVTCYASEGVYPPTLEYLQTHYGVQIDRQRYTVYYDVFAENLMPEITVLQNGD